MKIQTVDVRKFLLSEQEARKIIEKATSVCYPFKIDGVAYYLGKCVRCHRDIYEATLMSKEPVEIEIEMVGDKE